VKDPDPSGFTGEEPVSTAEMDPGFRRESAEVTSFE